MTHTHQLKCNVDCLYCTKIYNVAINIEARFDKEVCTELKRAAQKLLLILSKSSLVMSEGKYIHITKD